MISSWKASRAALRCVRYGLYLAVSLMVMAVAAAAQETSPLSLSDCVRLGLERNPTLRKLALNVDVAEEGVTIASAPYDAQLSLDGTYQDSELPGLGVPIQGGTKTLLAGGALSRNLAYGTTIGIGGDLSQSKYDEGFGGISELNSSMVSLSLRQALLKNAFGAEDRARVRSAEERLQQARLQYLDERDQLAVGIHEAYWNAAAAEAAYDINQRALARAGDLLKSNREKFEDGLLDETAILAAEAALVTREVEVLARRDAVQQTRDILLELIAVSVEEWDEVAVVFPKENPSGQETMEPDMWLAFDMAREERPDLGSLRALRRSIRQDVILRQQEARPDLSVFGRVGRGDSDEEASESFDFDRSVWSVGLEYVTPWSRSAERAVLAQSELRLRQVDRDIEALERIVLLECRLVARDLATAHERVGATIRAMGIQERKLELEQEKFAQGRSTTKVVVDYQDDLEFAQLSCVDAVARYQKDRVRYRAVQGILLRDSTSADGEGSAAERSP